MGQDPTLSHKTQAYIYRYIPVLFLIFIITALRKCLQGTKQMQAIMYSILLTFPLSIVANYLFLIYWDLGYLGAAYYSVAFNVFFLLFYLIYIHKMTDFKEKYWPKWSRNCLHGWDIFLKLGRVSFFLKKRKQDDMVNFCH
jgi:MATE family multidrug resistance protein